MKPDVITVEYHGLIFGSHLLVIGNYSSYKYPINYT